MWQVKIEIEAAKVFEGDGLDDEDRVVIHQWAKLVQEHGPESLRDAPQIWDDHELEGKWRGHRASRFSYSGRIIYKIEKKIVTVIVVRITADHDYR